jgi:hypothetical protein
MGDISRNPADHAPTAGPIPDQSTKDVERAPRLVVIAAAVPPPCWRSWSARSFSPLDRSAPASPPSPRGCWRSGSAWTGLPWKAGESARPTGNGAPATPRGNDYRVAVTWGRPA